MNDDMQTISFSRTSKAESIYESLMSNIIGVKFLNIAKGEYVSEIYGQSNSIYVSINDTLSNETQSLSL